MLNHAIAKNNNALPLADVLESLLLTSTSCFSLPLVFIMVSTWGLLMKESGCDTIWSIAALLKVFIFIRCYVIVRLIVAFKLRTVPIYKSFSLQLIVLFFVWIRFPLIIVLTKIVSYCHYFLVLFVGIRFVLGTAGTLSDE